MASPASQILASPEAETTPREPPALLEEIVREILLRVASPADLARASMACATFRRLIADPSFLRQYRSLHPPLLLGFLDGEFRATEAPDPSAPACRAFARAADFDFDGYVPRDDARYVWGTSDVRDGRVLLKYGPWEKKDGSVPVFPDLAVCDPLYRRYLLLPPIPGDLLASIQVDERKIKSFNACIVPSSYDEEDTTFRVMGMTQCPQKFAVFIFSSGTASWSIAASTTWEALSLTVPQDGCVLDYRDHNCFAYGCYYRKVYEKNKLLKFNMSTLEFSTVDLPPKHDKLEIVIVEAGKGMLGIFSQINAQRIRYSIWQNEGQESRKWKMVNIDPLPSDFFCFIVGALGGYIFLLGQSKKNPVEAACLSIEIETLQINRVGRMMGFLHRIFPYFGYPPPMSPRRI